MLCFELTAHWSVWGGGTDHSEFVRDYAANAWLAARGPTPVTVRSELGVYEPRPAARGHWVLVVVRGRLPPGADQGAGRAAVAEAARRMRPPYPPAVLEFFDAPERERVIV